MKGGVGKTTLAANVFRELFREKQKRTLLVDLDPQFNLSQMLYRRAAYEQIQKDKATIWHVLEPQPPSSVFHVSEEYHNQVGPVDDYTRGIKYLKSNRDIALRLLPGDFRLSLINLREGASQRTPRTRFRAYIDSARSLYDLVVLDCNPSSSFLTRLALETATHLVVPVRPDRYSVLGVEMLSSYVQQIPTIARSPEMAIIINGAANTNAALDVVAGLRGHAIYGPQTLTAEVPQSNVLVARQDFTGFASDRPVPYSRTIKQKLVNVALELATRLGIP